MPTIRRLIAATDLSEASLHAVDRGFELAARHGAHYTLLHALGLDALGPLRDLLGDEAELVAEKAIQHQFDALAAVAGDPARNAGVVTDVKIEPGLATRVLADYAASEQADLVLVGARGASVLSRLLVGSTASRLLRKCASPVLVVKKPGRTPYRRVLAPVDFSPGSLATLRMAAQIAPDADVLLLHSFDVPFEGMLQYAGIEQAVIHRYRAEARERALQRLHALAEEVGLDRGRYSVRIEHGEATRHILDAQTECRCDLVAMGKHGTHVTEELLLGSVTKHVLSEADADVLVVVDRRGPTLQPPFSGEDFV